MNRECVVMEVNMSAYSENSYEEDFNLWLESQAAALKAKDFEHIDLKNLVEEVESLGRSNKRELKSRCIVLITHLLKVKYQSDSLCNSWVSSISGARMEVELLIEESPSLKNVLDEAVADAYDKARRNASEETGLAISIFPKKCHWTLEELFPFLKTRN